MSVDLKCSGKQPSNRFRELLSVYQPVGVNTLNLIAVGYPHVTKDSQYYFQRDTCNQHHNVASRNGRKEIELSSQ